LSAFASVEAWHGLCLAEGMTNLLIRGLLTITLLGSAAAVRAEDHPPSTNLFERAPDPGDDGLDQHERLRRRYKRMRIVGGLVMGLSVLTIPIAAGVAVKRDTCEPKNTLGCGVISAPFLTTLGVTAVVSPAIVAGGITLGVGARRGRRLRLEAPQLAVDSHGVGLRLGGHF